MSRIASVFSKANHKAFIPYVTVGYPNIKTTLKAVSLLAEGGCDIIELGIPFSDPLADGTTIQKASFHALQNGVTPQVCFEVVAELRKKVEIPLVFMTYFNPILNYGLEPFCAACVNSGIDGMIVPDLPPEEGSELELATKNCRLDLIYLLAPTSSNERIELVSQRSSGFIYLVSVTGVTGARNSLPSELEAFISRVKRITSGNVPHHHCEDYPTVIARSPERSEGTPKQSHRRLNEPHLLPLCVGFGISTPEQAKQIAGIADGVIIGSQIIHLMESDPSLAALQDFVAQVREALDSWSKKT